MFPRMRMLLLLAIGVLIATPFVATESAYASGYVNHSEFNNIYFAERKSEFESRANVTEYDRVNLYTNPDSYIIYYLANFSDICVDFVEVHIWRGSDGNLWIRPWKGIIKCNGDEVRYNM